MTKEEAELKAKSDEEEMGNKICPLLGKKCVTCNCISYAKPIVRNRRDDDWDCHAPYCCNALNDYIALAEAIGSEVNSQLT